MASLTSHKVGQLIELNDGRQGTIRFVGQTEFAAGDWIGVEFEDATGKNDGSVQGNRYFECEMGHGMFLRPTGVAKILESPTPKPRINPTANSETSEAHRKKPMATTGRLSTTAANGPLKKTTLDPTASKRATINSVSPTLGPRAANGTKSPSKLAPRTAGSTATSSAASSRGPTPTTSRQSLPTRGVAPRTSLAPSKTTASSTATKLSSTTSRTQRSSLAPKPTLKPTSASNTRASTSRLSQATTVKPTTGPNGVKTAPALPSQSEDDDASEKEATENEQAKGDGSPSDQREDPAGANEEEVETEESEPTITLSPAKAKLQPAQETSALRRKIEEYEAKIRLLEKKRGEDVEKLAALEKLQTEKDRIERIVQTLQAKLKPQSQELSVNKNRIKELEEQLEKNESRLAEHESEMEMATLDREVAEETAESLRLELEALKEKQEELELEVEVLREENTEYAKDASPEERSNQGYLQLQRQNERYRDALMRLRDISQSTQAELKDQIDALEQDLKQFEDIRKQYDETREHLAESEIAIEDLKQQLDAALASEDMVEELTETNNDLTEENRKLRVEIDELQTINELNDEFETQRVENEKILQEEIDARGAALVEQSNRAGKQDEKLAEYEYTVNKFREVVSSLQNHIEDLKTSQQLSDAEADELTARSRAMTDLNMKLQSSAAKAQNSAVDVELRRLEAQEAADYLAVVLEFLPEGFKPEQDSVQVYLRFKRIAFKSRLLCDLFKDRFSGNVSNVPAELVFVSYSIVDKLTWISSTCDRFVGDIGGCSPERFGKYEQALHELDPVERSINNHIENWKKQDLRERQMDEDLRRTVSVLTHLSEVYLQPNLATFADEVLLKTALMQNHFEATVSVLAFSKSIVERGLQRIEEWDELGNRDNLHEPQQLDSLISLARSARINANKACVAIKELQERSMSLNQQDTDEALSEYLARARSSASIAVTLGASLNGALEDPADSNSPAESAIRTALNEFRETCFPDSPTSSNPLETFNTYLKGTVADTNSLLTLAADSTRITKFTRSTAPWIMRAEALKVASQTNSIAEAETQRLKDLVNERSGALRNKDLEVEEQNVKIELLEARMRDASNKAKRAEDLQSQVNIAKQRERQLVDEVDKKYWEISTLKDERDRWKSAAETRQPLQSAEQRGNFGRPLPIDESFASGREVDVLKLEIRALQDAIKYVRNDKQYTQDARGGPINDMSWLSEPLLPNKQQKEEKDRQEKISREGMDIMRSLLRLSTSSHVVDISNLPDNKLAWRPAREKSAWIVARQMEDWEAWFAKKDAFVDKAKDCIGSQSRPMAV